MPSVHAQIGSIWIDVSVKEEHGVSAEVTEHPVETGSNVADHIRPNGRTITIHGLVTNHPIELPGSHADGARIDPSPIAIEGEPSVGALGIIPGVDQGVAILGALKIDVRSKRVFSATPLRFTSDFDRVGTVHAALIDAVENRKLVTVVTALLSYDNVALTDLQVDKDGAGQKLEFQCTGRVIRIVSSQTVELPKPVDARAKKPKSLGKQATTTASDAEGQQTTSVLAKLFGVH